MSRKSIIAKNAKSASDLSSGFNYQKEVKQLKKDIRIRDDKIVLLNKDAANKKQTIELLQSGLATKDEQLQLQDKEILNLESKVALLNEKAEALEKHNEEMQKELLKQTKLAQIASKKQSVAEQTNLNLMTQINALAQNLNNLKNVNMALSSQLTMTMTAAQNTMHQNMFNNANTVNDSNGNNTNNGGLLGSSDGVNISPMLSETSPMPNVLNPGGVNMAVAVANADSNNQRRESIDEQDEDNADESSKDNQSNKGEDSTENEEDGLAELPESSTMSPTHRDRSKGKSSSKRMSKRMSQSAGSSATRKRSGSGSEAAKYVYGNWDDHQPNKENIDSTGDSEKEKTKRKREKDKDKDKDKPPNLMKQKSSKRESRSTNKSKKRKPVETEETLQETEEEVAWEDGDDHKVKQDDLDFGNAGPVEKSKKKRKKKDDGDQDKGGAVCFDTYLDGITSDKLKITKNGRLIAMDYFSDSLYIISSTGFSSGKHEWEIKTIKTGDLADEIGVCSEWGSLEVNGNSISDMGSSQLGARAVYANDPASSHSFHDAFDAENKLTYDKKFKKREFVWGKGDVIKVSLNCNKWSIKFYLNGKQVGKSIPLVPDLTYYPILCAYGACSYQVISCT